jgi:hypothetical protein
MSPRRTSKAAGTLSPTLVLLVKALEQQHSQSSDRPGEANALRALGELAALQIPGRGVFAPNDGHLDNAARRNRDRRESPADGLRSSAVLCGPCVRHHASGVRRDSVGARSSREAATPRHRHPRVPRFRACRRLRRGRRQRESRSECHVGCRITDRRRTLTRRLPTRHLQRAERRGGFDERPSVICDFCCSANRPNTAAARRLPGKLRAVC